MSSHKCASHKSFIVDPYIIEFNSKKCRRLILCVNGICRHGEKENVREGPITVFDGYGNGHSTKTVLINQGTEALLVQKSAIFREINYQVRRWKFSEQ